MAADRFLEMLYDEDTTFEALLQAYNASNMQHRMCCDYELVKAWESAPEYGIMTPAAFALFMHVRDRTLSLDPMLVARFVARTPHVGIVSAIAQHCSATMLRYVVGSGILSRSHSTAKQKEKMKAIMVDNGVWDTMLEAAQCYSSETLRMVLRSAAEVGISSDKLDEAVSEYMVNKYLFKSTLSMRVVLEEGYDKLFCTCPYVLATYIKNSVKLPAENEAVALILAWILQSATCRPMLQRLMCVPACRQFFRPKHMRKARLLLAKAMHTEVALLQQVDAWLCEEDEQKQQEQQQPSLVSLMLRGVLLQQSLLLERSALRTFDVLFPLD